MTSRTDAEVGPLPSSTARVGMPSQSRDRAQEGSAPASTAVSRHRSTSAPATRSSAPSPITAVPADALLTLAGQDRPPLRFVAGADAVEGVSAKARELLAQAEASRELGGNLGHDDTGSA